ncbi:hypothetical protein GWJ21_02995 [Bacillus coagulans]|uniref:Uncharacterized protein n=1 Tax=Heyndrickxia coagulans TaxID=1398 RepID=A0A150KFA9_HEYCO|nr:hypothetical protein B4099_1263 [Heyndrickxia coagulans]NCG66944.1 hypothetical protein [Heyndrickxia coagulans]
MIKGRKDNGWQDTNFKRKQGMCMKPENARRKPRRLNGSAGKNNTKANVLNHIFCL